MNKVVLLIALLSFLLMALSSLGQGYALYFGNDKTISSSVQNSSSIAPLTSAKEKDGVYVAWVDKNHIYFTFSRDGGNKFTPVILLSDSNKSSISPKISTTEKGNVYVVWTDIDNKTGYSSIEFISSNDSGMSFSSQKELGGGKLISFSPVIATTEKGNVYLTWINKDNKTGSSSIEFISSNDGGTSFSPSKKLTGTKAVSLSPQIAATEKGDVYVVWVDKNSKTGDTDIVFRSSNDSGVSFHDRTKLRRSESVLSVSPEIATTEKGNVYLVWTDKNTTTGDSDITFRNSNDQGRDFHRTINLNKGENEETNSTFPQLVATQNDTIYVVWTDNHIQFKEILLNDSLVGNPILISNKTVSSFSPQIVGTKNGNFFVVWIDRDNSNDTSLHFKRISQKYFDRNS